MTDGSVASQELRDWLSVISLERLQACIDECLSDSFQDSPLALQDATNELGRRLGFKVTPGRYRGVKGEVGNDGLWLADDKFALLVEVKTTDVYRVNLDTIARYRESLIQAKSIESEQSSILIAVGRQDTGDLEAQIRGSRHAWDIRLISLDALVRLAEVKEELNDWATSNKINQLLRPVEYTRLDGIVELLFAAKLDLETSSPVAPPEVVKDAEPTTTVTPKQLEQARDSAVSRIANKLDCTFVRHGRALRSSSDGTQRLVCLASQRYDGPAGSGNYWFGFTPSQKDFLADAKKSWVSMVCADSSKTILVPWSEFKNWLPELWTTPATQNELDVRHWHLYFNDYGNRVELMRSGGGLLRDIATFVI